MRVGLEVGGPEVDVGEEKKGGTVWARIEVGAGLLYSAEGGPCPGVFEGRWVGDRERGEAGDGPDELSAAIRMVLKVPWAL